MKRESAVADSFDLFLDTICNAFGGVVFLAILIAILIQTRAIVSDPLHSDESPVTPQQVRELFEQLESSQSDYAAIQVSLKLLPPASESPQDLDHQTNLAKRTAMEEQVQLAMQKLTGDTKAFGKQLEKNAEAQQTNRQIPITLETTKESFLSKTDAFDSLIGDRQATYRVPRERSTGSASALVLLRRSRFFVAKTPDQGSKQFNDSQVTTGSTVGGGITITPKNGSGWDLADSEVLSLVQSARSRRYAITVAVWPDSYGDFEVLKKLLVENQVPYQLWPQQEGEELTVFLGAGQTKVQ